MYKTPDDEMIARMLHLPPDKSKLSAQVHTSEYEIDNWTVYDVLDQICEDTDL